MEAASGDEGVDGSAEVAPAGGTAEDEAAGDDGAGDDDAPASGAGDDQLAAGSKALKL